MHLNVYLCVRLRDNPKISASRKGEPMSPVRENVMMEPDESDREILNLAE